ncbi:MAG: hypothetical protein JSR87_10795 [Proteobacteria bacterium]|nr:hypothetical protein [Pseudomonadota bacterium]MBS0574423.1 hypothetical protein [Pseudomonadota bacterium]
MHLIVRFPPAPYPAWKADFDAHAEDRDQSGLGLLQLWRSADAPDRALALFEVHDRAAAQGWLDRQQALHGAIDADFVRPA